MLIIKGLGFMNRDDDQKEKKLPSNPHYLSSVLNQSMIPISVMLSEAAKVDILITIGRALMTPALVISTIIVLASLPIVRAWDRYQTQPGQPAISIEPSPEAVVGVDVDAAAPSQDKVGNTPTPGSSASILPHHEEGERVKSLSPSRKR